MVLVLSTLNTLLAQLISLPELHTAILLSPEGQLISVASDPSRPKDKARVVAGVSSEVWQETKARGYGTIESEVSDKLRTHFLLKAHSYTAGPHSGAADRTREGYQS